MKRVLFDIEGDGLLPEVTKIHCIAAADLDTRTKMVWGPNEIPAALEYLAKADLLLAHNGLSYDFPVLEKLYGFVVPFEKKLDTLILMRVLFPDLKTSDGDINEARIRRGQPGLGEHYGKHSLRAWGIRLGVQKGDFEGPWDAWTQAMQDYCVQDIDTTLALWDHAQAFIAAHPEATDWTKVLHLEHRTTLVTNKITESGWPFDLQKAGDLHAHLTGEKDRLDKALVAEFIGWWQKGKEFVPKGPNKRHGYWGHYEPDPSAPQGQRFVGYPCTKLEWVTFNPKSRHHIARALKMRGWKPSEFTDSGLPKLDDEIIENIAIEFPEAGNLATYLMVEKRLGQLANGKQALLKHVANDCCIHGQYNPMGTVTSRASHFNPNLGQVPNSASQYGKEFRELFTVPKGWDLIGADMEGLEIRALCHYLSPIDGGAFAKLALEGDVHWANVQAMGLAGEDEERDKHNQLHTIIRESGAKTFFYAWLYGCGDEKGGRILLDVCRLAYSTNPEWKHLLEKFFGSAEKAPGKSRIRAEGKALKQRFLTKIPALKKLIGKLKSLVEEYDGISGLDKRRIPVRALHAALNTLLQSCGAILCKQWLCDFYDAAIAKGYRYGWEGDFVILGWIHDEIQIAARNGLGEELGRLLTRTAGTAGQPFGFRCRLNSNYKIGRTWADTH